jgi:hypothetical protein
MDVWRKVSFFVYFYKSCFQLKFMIKNKPAEPISLDKVRAHLGDSSKNLAELTVNMVIENPELIEPLLEISLTGSEPWSQRASRVVSICCCRFPEMLKPHVSRIITHLSKLKSEGSLRNFLKIFSEVPLNLSNRNKSILLNLCFDYLSGNYSIAVKAYSMDVLYHLSLEIPEIKNELYVLIETQMPVFSAGLKSRGKKILKKLSDF